MAGQSEGAGGTFFWSVGFNNYLVPELKDCVEDTASAAYYVNRISVDNSGVAQILNRYSADIIKALKDRKFVRVSDDKSEYLDQDRLFGDLVHDRFRSARGDIREAGNCLAVDCGTAAVFHLMRAAEFALRALADDRRVGFPSTHPIESQQWIEIIKQLNKAIGELINQPRAKWPNEQTRQAQIRFYQDAMVEFMAFNDAWRRHVSHAHEGALYDPLQAMSVMTHTRAFMQKLAAKIGEGLQTDEYWQHA